MGMGNNHVKVFLLCSAIFNTVINFDMKLRGGKIILGAKRIARNPENVFAGYYHEGILRICVQE